MKGLLGCVSWRWLWIWLIGLDYVTEGRLVTFLGKRAISGLRPSNTRIYIMNNEIRESLVAELMTRFSGKVDRKKISDAFRAAAKKAEDNPSVEVALLRIACDVRDQ